MKFSDIPRFINDGDYEVNMSLTYLHEKIEEWKREDNIQLNPDFQRGHVWSEAQQIAWVEYFMSGGVSGRVLYFNAPWWGSFDKTKHEYKDFVLVDGLQRLTAFLRFIDGEIGIFGGNRFGDFEDRLRMCRASANLRINVNSLQTKAEVLRWYIQMNDGGTPHTKEEINKVKVLLEREGDAS